MNAEFPKTEVQTRIVHLVRHSLSHLDWRDRKLVATELRLIYQAQTPDRPRQQLEAWPLPSGARNICRTLGNL